jgi:hypothetical protein
VIQAVQIVSSVAQGFFHSLRKALQKSPGIPYSWWRSAAAPVRLEMNQSWPQPSPISPNMPYAVLHVPTAELKEFRTRVVSRFMGQVAYSWMSAIRYLRARPHLDCPDDTTFARYLTRTVYAYFLTDVLDDADRELLAQNGCSSLSVFKSDLAPVSTVDPFPGLYITGSACYFRETPGGMPEIVGIAMLDKQFRPGTLIRPTDGNCWKRAKMHVLQGATYLSLFVTHPKCHFPMDAVLAVTKTLLPKEHRVHQLLAPHMYMQLPLDFAVLHIRNGPGFNDPRLYYTAFSGAGRSQFRLFEYSFTGLAGHPAFPPYSFEYLRRSRPTDYTRFLFGYYDVILDFVRKVMAEVEVDDVLLEWARLCNHYSRGFGGTGEVVDGDRIAACVAYVIWNGSVVHSADHWEFHAIPMEHKPTRLRIPPPFDRSECSFDERSLTQPDDRLRHYMWHEMYVRDWTLRRLSDVDYGFAEPHLQLANREFVAALEAYGSNGEYIPFGEVGTSIQF